MKDDSLSDVVHYCSMCDSLVEESHECGGFPFAKEQPDNVGINAKLALTEIEKQINANVYAKEIWNAAIEAAALEVGNKLSYPTEACAIIRGLRK